MRTLRKQISRKLFSFFFIISLISCFFAFINTIDLQKCKISENSQNNSKNILNIPISSNYWSNFSFIHINGNWSQGVSWGWIQGDGTQQNPYVIENMTINAGSSPTKNGIYIQNSKNDYFVIKNCTIYNIPSGFPNAAIRLENTCNGTIFLNNCSNNVGIGIYLLSNCKNNTIDSNIIVNKNLGRGIYLSSSHNNTLIRNIANNNTNGIYIQSSNFNQITYNHANNNTERGFYIYSSDNNYIGNNRAEQNRGGDNGEGIILQDSRYNIVKKNTLNTNNGNGIRIYGSHNNTIDYNVIENNTKYGVLFIESLENNITRNVIKNNTIIGISISDDSSEKNSVFKNLFVENGLHAQDNVGSLKINYWNTSTVGNYWDNITGTDSNKDGIYDSASYTISGAYSGGEDHYPIFGDPRFPGGKIHIDDTGVSNHTWMWTSTRLWCMGTGTQSDPFIIDDLEVIGDGSGSVVMIGNSTKHFVISNCNITASGTETGTHDSGISIWDCFNGKVINSKIFGNLHGIFTHGGTNLIIRENIVESNSYFGITTQLTNSTTIESNIIRDHVGGFGVYIDTCENVNITDNEITNSGVHQIDLYLSSGCFVLNNSVKNGQATGIYLLWSENNSINNNEIISNVQSGVQLANGGNNTLFHNNIEDNGLYGIYLFNGGTIMNFNKILNNSIIHNNRTGISIESSLYTNDTRIIGNIINNNGHSQTTSDANEKSGIYIYNNCAHYQIYKNTINNNYANGIFFQDNIISSSIKSNNISFNLNYGIYFSSQCDNNEITSNYICNNTFGIGLLNNNQNTTISSNTISKNSIIGILVYICNYTTIRDNKNTISNNGVIGLALYRSNHSEIIFNRIVNNPIGVQLNESNYNNVSINDLTGNGVPFEQNNCLINYHSNNLGENLPSGSGNDDDDDTDDDSGDNNGKNKSFLESNSTVFIIIIAIMGSVAISGAIVTKKRKSKKVSAISSKPFPDSQFKIDDSKPPHEGVSTAFKTSDLKRVETGVKAKIPQGFKPQSGKENVLTAAELAEIQRTELEVDIEKKEVICIVHKGPIDGAIYLCPKCKTYYCFKCAQALKEKGEKCWSCESDIKI